MSVHGGFFEITGAHSELVRIMDGIRDNADRDTADSSMTLDLWLEMQDEWFRVHDAAVLTAARAAIDEGLEDAIVRLTRYVDAGSLIHTASSYRTGDGVVHLIEFDDLRRVLAAASRHIDDKSAGADVTPEGVEVRPGQVWRSLDKRDSGRTVTVESVFDGKAKVNSGATRSTISVKRMRRNSTGWALVKDVRK